MPYPLNISFPSILYSESGVSLELASSINLELPDNVPAEKWKELTIIRGGELEVRIKWNGQIVWSESSMELFSQIISKSQLWAQLLFSVSLELPSAPDTQDDIILKLTRMDINNAVWSPSAVESQIAAHLPTCRLSRLSLTASFGSISRPIVETRLETPSGSEPLGIHLPEGGLHVGWGQGSQSERNNHTLLDSAFSSLLMQSLAPTAPCIFCPGYLESLWLSASQISSISESLNHVLRVTTSTALKQKLLSLASNDTQGVGSALWRLAKSRVDNSTRWGEPPSLLGLDGVEGSEMILGQEEPGTPADDLLWLQDPEDTSEAFPVGPGIHHQPTLLECCGEELPEEEMLL